MVHELHLNLKSCKKNNWEQKEKSEGSNVISLLIKVQLKLDNS